MKEQKVFVTATNKQYSHIRNTYVTITEQDWDLDGRTIYRTTATYKRLNDNGEVQDEPIWLYREEFQREAEIEAKDFVLNHYKETGTFPKMITYGEKELKYILSRRIIRNQDGSIQVEYHWSNHILSFAVVNSTEIDDDGKLYLKLHSVRYLGISSYEYPEPKEYYVE